ncbi:MAG: hypothetical protein AAB822_01825 [Patescibacteria group bacterium]
MKICLTCKKGTNMSAKRNLLRGKYNPTPKTRRYPNLQWATFTDGRRTKICASCIKKGKHLVPASLKSLPKRKSASLEQITSKRRNIKKTGRHI